MFVRVLSANVRPMSGFVTPERPGKRPGGFGCGSFPSLILYDFLPGVRRWRETSRKTILKRYKYDRDMVAGRHRSRKGASVSLCRIYHNAIALHVTLPPGCELQRPSTHNCWTTIAKTNFRRQPAGITVTITPMVGRRHPPDHRKAERDGHQSISGATPFPLTITRSPPCPIIWTKS